ncbi:unnamed protein product [Caenorhabditis auriculariae]|uniref:MMS19 nucleotide excision repair protein n=1 Tax=Caenorhabditis auriculariae TaxID=2777116 RepID=A0A8S1GVX0_9PELO|nr:unnamed protein product [Caenorhabditis auriculariae]
MKFSAFYSQPYGLVLRVISAVASCAWIAVMVESDEITWETRLQNHSSSLTQFLESKREKLLSDFPDNREEALTEIVQVICALSPDFLSDEQVALLLEFLLSRLESSALAGGSVISGIHHLVTRCKNLPEGFEMPLVRFMFKEGNVQSWAQKDRQLQYEVLQWLLKRRLSLLQALGVDFVATFIKTISGERDPRCLLAAFQMFVTVAKNFGMGPFSEEMFETIACYFPVEFKASATEKSISRAYLSTCCSACLVASPNFADFCFLLIAEKFEDDECSPEQKDDVCALLALAADTFPSRAVLQHLKDLLAGLRMVGLNPKNRGEMSGEVDEALGALLRTVRRLEEPKFEWGCIDSFIENLEPFVLQAEMGLSGKGFRLLRCAFNNASNVGARKILGQALAWLTTLVQGDSVNVAANKAEIIGESLVFLVEWVELAASRPEVGEPSLTSYESNIFAAIDVAREYVPSKSVEALQKCAIVYCELKSYSSELRSRIEIMVKNGLTTVMIPEEIPSYLELVAKCAKNSLFELDLTAIDSWNRQKIIPVLCSAITDQASWELLKVLIEKELRKRVEDSSDDLSTALSAYVSMCSRSQPSEELVYGQILHFAHILTSMPDSGSEEQEQLLGASLQKMTLLLSSTSHSNFMSTISALFRGSTVKESSLYLLEERFSLSFLQCERKDLLEEARTSSHMSKKFKNRILFASVNRGFVENQDISATEESAVVVKALLLRETPKGIRLLKELLLEASNRSQSDEELEKLFPYLLDFNRLDSEPTLCRYETNGPLWRQRIFFMIVPAYKEVIDLSYSTAGKGILYGFLPPLLEFAQSLGNPHIKDQFSILLPMFMDSLRRDEALSTSVFRSIPSFIQVAEVLDPQNIAVLVNRISNVINNDSTKMATVLDSLESLRFLAARQPARSLQPFIQPVTVALNKLLAHRKRLIRQRAAAVKNTWETLAEK